jgi:hypothetical protein
MLYSPKILEFLINSHTLISSIILIDQDRTNRQQLKIKTFE